MAELRERVLQAAEAAWKSGLEALRELVEIPTVSAWGGEALRQGAEAVASLLREREVRTRILEAGGAPAVYGELGGGPVAVLTYAHYDVQPPDPVEAWRHEPFRLSEEGGLLYGRGVADSKGNVAAMAALAEAVGPYLDELGLRLKFLVEGEEEVGSPTLPRLVEVHRDLLGAQAGYIWEAGWVNREGGLTIYLGAKGMVYVEVAVRGPARDVHSGYAPLVPNPAWGLVKLLASLRDEAGRVTLEGFYDDVDPRFLREAEELLPGLDPGELEGLREELGLGELEGGVGGAEAYRRLMQPSLNISGMCAGYGGRGVKTVIPAEAAAKLDIRLVPGQRPERVLRALEERVRRLLPGARLTVHSAYPAHYVSHREAIVRAAAAAAEEVYGRQPRLVPLAAGSGPEYLFTDVLGIPTSGGGVGYYGSRIHVPDENIRLEDFRRAVKHAALTLLNYARP